MYFSETSRLCKCRTLMEKTVKKSLSLNLMNKLIKLIKIRPMCCLGVSETCRFFSPSNGGLG